MEGVNTCCHAIPFFHTTTVYRHHSQSRALLPAAAALLQCRASRDETAGRCTRVMSRGSKGGRGGALDLNLKLRLSPPAPARERAASSSSSDEEEWSSSSPSSCLSSEGEREPQPPPQLQWSDSPEATSMVLAACPRCLMYVMLSEADPRCPRCRSPVLLDFLHHAAAARNSRDDGDQSRRAGGGGRSSRRP